MRSHVDSPRVSLDALAHVDSPRVSVDTASHIESSTSNSSGTYSNPFYINFLSIALRDITNQVIQPAAPPRNSDKESEPVSQEEGGPVSQQVNEVDGDTIQTKVYQAPEKAREKVKQLSEEALRHITGAKVMYKPMEGIFNIRSSGCKPKSWELNYPALAFLLNGGYYADYAGIMDMMGLPVMHHTTWDNLVTWVGTHVEQLTNWSCDQVRADIVKRGDKAQWTASFDGFYLTRGHHL